MEMYCHTGKYLAPKNNTQPHHYRLDELRWEESTLLPGGIWQGLEIFSIVTIRVGEVAALLNLVYQGQALFAKLPNAQAGCPQQRISQPQSQ